VDSLANHLKELLEQRAIHVAEMEGHARAVESIDAELNDARTLLGLGPVVAAPVLTGEPLKKTCEACGEPFVVRSNRQRMCHACQPQAGTAHRSTDEIAGRVEPDSICERCGKAFRRSVGAAGRFCSRACYDSPGIDDRRAWILTALESGPAFASDLAQRPGFVGLSRGTIQSDLQALRREGRVRSTGHGWALLPSVPVPTVAVIAPRVPDVPVSPSATPVIVESRPDVPRTNLPERRCGRCLLKFRPTKEREYVCPLCVDKPKVTPPTATTDEYEVVHSGRDFPSAEGHGSSLAVETKVHI
jgi:hypothetical protein